ncbi:hypothetical protein [Nocardioides psychrotolerans]|uniref:hypothetical protein n=1 Tax=Nocardioides psychrotolerans TaxID=1005945 RepID=UPI0031379A52
MLRHLWWLLGLALVLGGVAVVLSSQTSSSDFGWFAYTPPSEGADWQMGWGDTLSGTSAMVVSRWQLMGGAAAAAGLVVLAGGLGFRLGRRRNAPRGS